MLYFNNPNTFIWIFILAALVIGIISLISPPFDNTISTAKIVNKAVTTDKLADGSVTDDKISAARDLVEVGPTFLGTGGSFKSHVSQHGAMVLTVLEIDIEGCVSTATKDHIIGGKTGASTSYLCKLDKDIVGTVDVVSVRCLEAPATGSNNIAFYSAVESTGAQGSLVTSLTERLCAESGDRGETNTPWVKNQTLSFNLDNHPLDNSYLYMTVGADAGAGNVTLAAGTYTNGKFLLSIRGHKI